MIETNYLCLDCEFRFTKPYYKHRFDGVIMIRTACCLKCKSKNIKKIRFETKPLF